MANPFDNGTGPGDERHEKETADDGEEDRLIHQGADLMRSIRTNVLSDESRGKQCGMLQQLNGRHADHRRSAGSSHAVAAIPTQQQAIDQNLSGKENVADDQWPGDAHHGNGILNDGRTNSGCAIDLIRIRHGSLV